jgi:hypothetical protein
VSCDAVRGDLRCETGSFNRQQINVYYFIRHITAPLTCSTDACDRLDDGLPWYTLHCYGSSKKKKKEKKKITREREMLF